MQNAVSCKQNRGKTHDIHERKLRIFALKVTISGRKLHFASHARLMQILTTARATGRLQQEICRGVSSLTLKHLKETIMKWNKPEFSDLRFGFEVTMYIANR
jgi:coenzyme PQQ precursor peptide PqqA